MNPYQGWVPAPIDTSRIKLSSEFLDIIEILARNAHDNWARRRMAEGWRYGPNRDDNKFTHPDIVPYEALPVAEQEYDRELATMTIKVLISLGYRVVR